MTDFQHVAYAERCAGTIERSWCPNTICAGKRPFSSEESLLELLGFQVSGLGNLFDQLFDGLDRRFNMAVTLAVIWCKIADSDAPSIHRGPANASIKLGPVVGSKPHWDTELNKIFDVSVQHGLYSDSRGRVPFPPVNYRPSG
ncbi:hypothetical protein OUZ56_033005 [Daphnia magna]|uniref:Uncharacterized protein n=1 Tax=Daphnia magna TaxID=35525 RepID=A0ABR0B9Z2_9CRUS|nr:hypothetical protein OUZ56_033005 [Daphnia magna]